MLSSHSYHKLRSGPSLSTSTKRNPKRSTTAATSSRLSPVPERSKTKLTMKVKELRNWLSELGDKNQEHYQRFQHSKKGKAPTSKKKKNNNNNEKIERDDLLGIQSKPSTTSTCPSTAIVEDNDPLFATSFSSDDDSLSNREGPKSDFYQKTDKSTTKELFDDDGMGSVTSKDHCALLLKQAPRTQEGDSYTSRFDNASCHDSRDDKDNITSRNNEVRMHNSSVFRDQLLTKATLDAMSQSLDEQKTSPKNLGEHLQQLTNKHALGTLVTLGSNSGYEASDDTDSNTEGLYPFLGTNSSSSNSSSSIKSNDAPSIASGVLVSKMANIFLNNHQGRDCETAIPPPPERRRYVDPRDLSFLQSSAPTLETGDREDLAYSKPPPTPTTTVGKGIRKFGGPPKTLVERRKEQLHKNFGDTRAAVFVHKKTWGQKSPHGRYQRRTTVEKIYKK